MKGIFYINPKNLFRINKLSLLPCFSGEKFFGPGFFLQILYPLKARKLGVFLFGPWTTIQENGSSLLFWRHHRVSFAQETNINSENLQNRSIFSFFSLAPVMIVQKGYSVRSSAILCHFSCYIKKRYTNKAFCKKRELSLSLSVCACFARGIIYNYSRRGGE